MRQHKYIATGNLRIITNNVLKKLFIERPKNIEVMPIILENLSFKYQVLVIAFQVGVIKLVLISLSFWNGPIILRSKLMKQ